MGGLDDNVQVQSGSEEGVRESPGDHNRTGSTVLS